MREHPPAADDPGASLYDEARILDELAPVGNVEAPQLRLNRKVEEDLRRAGAARDDI